MSRHAQNEPVPASRPLIRAWVRVSLVLLALVLLAAAFVRWLNERDEDPVGNSPTRVAATPAQVARGAYLARAGNCMGCHTVQGGASYAGGRGIPTPFGTIYAPTSRPTRQPASVPGRPTNSGAPCTTAERETGDCSTRRSRIRTTPVSAGKTRMRSTPTCKVSPRSRAPTRRTPFSSRSTNRPRSRSGVRSTSGPSVRSQIRRAAPNGTAALTWSKGSGIATPATPAATRLAPLRARSISRAA
jgi:hypothetical protein